MKIATLLFPFASCVQTDKLTLGRVRAFICKLRNYTVYVYPRDNDMSAPLSCFIFLILKQKQRTKTGGDTFPGKMNIYQKKIQLQKQIWIFDSTQHHTIAQEKHGMSERQQRRTEF